jgi:enterobactin synthetase component D / holo-[acyl-carrier protein] synthase
MIEEIVPPWVATVATFDDDPADWLWPAEADLVARAVESRVCEFTTGRMCARRALAQLGIKSGPILSGARREALWPETVVGSITHCKGYRAAAVARRDRGLALGIDAELDSPLPAGLLEFVAVERESAWIARQSCPEAWGRLLFSAKESVYKALFPVTRCWLDFADVQVTFSPTEQSFAATVRPELSTCAFELTSLQGRYLRRNGLLLTALVVPSRPLAAVR